MVLITSSLSKTILPVVVNLVSHSATIHNHKHVENYQWGNAGKTGTHAGSSISFDYFPRRYTLWYCEERTNKTRDVYMCMCVYTYISIYIHISCTHGTCIYIYIHIHTYPCWNSNQTKVHDSIGTKTGTQVDEVVIISKKRKPCHINSTLPFL